MKFKKIFVAVAAAILFFNTVNAQEFSSEVVKQDCDKKHYVIGAIGVMGVNAVIGSWNRFVCRAPWAQVGLEDMKNPWEKEVKFDMDWYWTNFVLHPYQGGLYYLAARNANLNLLESLLYAAGGSLVWEYFFETNAPSTNDLVYTSIGGMVTGEMLYRLSLEAQAKNHTVLSFMGNPVRLYSDFVQGHAPKGPSGMLEDCSVKAMLGMALASSKANDEKLNEVFPFFFGGEFRAIYADPYGHDSNEPYSQFYFEFGGAGGKGSGEGADSTEQKLMYDVHIFSDGMLLSRAPDFGEDIDTTFGICMEYDFIWNSFMELSSLATGVAFKQRFNSQDSWKAYQLRLSGVLMGTSDFYYLRRGNIVKPEGMYRDYGYTTGVEGVAKLTAVKKAGIEFDWTVHGYAFWKYPGQKQDCDDTGWEYIAFSDVSLEMPVEKNVYLGIADEFYFKKGVYDNAPSIWTMHNAINLYARFKFM
ncbi:DUF3943 domain-containing protein [Treponema sp.]|uniref:DUF3943 domain-containing protein n=1 Tax=Treponema sp. TaxID=166 RepID=UPI00298E803A|nr:DUF3943 domain-containing protein [Treponema sp.]MCQ2242141.1 DUF3943 domain-containing protein [Treponema sp.]